MYSQSSLQECSLNREMFSAGKKCPHRGAVLFLWKCPCSLRSPLITFLAAKPPLPTPPTWFLFPIPLAAARAALDSLSCSQALCGGSLGSGHTTSSPCPSAGRGRASCCSYFWSPPLSPLGFLALPSLVLNSSSESQGGGVYCTAGCEIVHLEIFSCLGLL